jgi:hypothetical protein
MVPGIATATGMACRIDRTGAPTIRIATETNPLPAGELPWPNHRQSCGHPGKSRFSPAAGHRHAIPFSLPGFPLGTAIAQPV